MKKIIAVFLAALMFVGALHVATVPVFATEITQDDINDAPVPTEDPGWTLPGDGAVSGYREFSVECDYCGETHEGFIGIFMAMFHALLSAFNLAKKAIER